MKKILILPLLLCTLYFVRFPGTAHANTMGLTKHGSLSVSALVGPQVSDFQFAMNYAGSSVVHEGETITYTITYGAKQSAALTTADTIVVHYNTNRAPDGSLIADYVSGSATYGYNHTAPVIDTINHTITWTIPALPAGVTNQTVSFKLGVNSTYDSTNRITFYNRADMSNQYVTMPQQIVHQDYLYTPILPGPTATPTPQAAPTPTPTPTPPPPPINHIAFTGVSDSGAAIAIHTTTPVKMTVFYGTTKNNLSQSVSTSRLSTDSNITLTDLTPHTTYYFKIKTIDQWGSYYLSELYIFKTAKETFKHKLGNNVIVITTNGNVLLSNSQKQVSGVPPYLVLTPHNTYEISYRLGKNFPFRSIDAVVRNKVLAANTYSPTKPETNLLVPMQEMKPSFFVADLQTLTPGTYEIFVRVSDTYGNIVEQKIADLLVIPYLTVYNAHTDTPIPDARVDFSYFDLRTHQYKPLNPALFGSITNPDYTNHYGKIPTTLPIGKYRVKVSALLYDSKTVDFTIGTEQNQQFPTIYLSYDPINPWAILANIMYYLAYIVTTVTKVLHVIAANNRSFTIIAALVTGSSVLLALLLFLLKSRIALKHLPHFVLFHWHLLLKQHKQKFYYGGVTDEAQSPLGRVQIDVTDAKKKTILTQISTNALGRFYLRNQYDTDIDLVFVKPGYAPATLHVQKDMDIPDKGLALEMTKGEQPHPLMLEKVIASTEEVFGLLFETSLVLSLILEAVFFSVFGFTQTLPFFTLSILNIILWLFYMRERA